jgi:cell division protein FtsW
MPVTGQTLPLISSGGSSIWMTCFALGIIISVTKKREKIAEEQKDAAKREALKKLIDAELASEEEVLIIILLKIEQEIHECGFKQ